MDSGAWSLIRNRLLIPKVFMLIMCSIIWHRIYSLGYILLYFGCELRVEVLQLSYLGWLNCDLRWLLGQWCEIFICIVTVYAYIWGYNCCVNALVGWNNVFKSKGLIMKSFDILTRVWLLKGLILELGYITMDVIVYVLNLEYEKHASECAWADYRSMMYKSINAIIIRLIL